MSMKDNLKEVEAMLEAGYTYQYVADYYGVTRQRIFQLCPKYSTRSGKLGRPVGSSYIYRNFVKYLEDRNIGIMQFCKECGLHSNCVIGVMTGKKNPNKTIIDKLLKGTGMKYEDLFALE